MFYLLALKLLLILLSQIFVLSFAHDFLLAAKSLGQRYKYCFHKQDLGSEKQQQ